MSTWRPLDPAAQPDGPRRLTESLDRVARKIGAPRADALRAVFSRWTDIVGEAVAAHARPASLRDGVLVVVVDDPAWTTQLRYLMPKLLARCAELVGSETVREIRLRVQR